MPSSTNPAITGARIRQLKRHLMMTYRELADLFGVEPLAVQRWAAGKFAPRLEFQRTLARLEQQHGLRLPDSLKAIADERN